MEQKRPSPKTPEFDKIRDQIAAIMAGEKLSYQAIAQECGVPKGTLSTFMTDSYAGRNENVSEKLERWLRTRLEAKRVKSRAPSSPDFIETPTARRFTEALSFTQALADICVVAADPGLGKTTTLKRYTRDNANCWFLMMEPHINTMVKFTTNLALALEIAPGHRTRVMEATKDKLSHGQGLLIIDEGQYLTPPMLNQVRAFNEICGVGVALFGNRNIHAQIEGRARDVAYAQFFSRIGMRLNLSKPKSEDIRLFAQAWGIQGEAEMKLLQVIGKKPGALRNIDKTLKLATIAANGAGEPLDAAFIRSAYERLSVPGD